MRNTLTAIIISLALSAEAFAQSEALTFIRGDRNPVTTALAGAGSTSLSAGTAYSTFANPALIPLAKHSFDIAASYSRWAPKSSDMDNISFGVSYKLPMGLGFSAGVVSGSYDKIEMDEGSFKPSDLLVGGSVAYALNGNLSFGATARFASEKIAPGVSLSALNCDIFALWRGGFYGVGAGIVGLGGKVKSESGSSYNLPTSAKLSGDVTFNPFEGGEILLTADADYYFSSHFGMAAGAAFSYGPVSVRAGYRYAQEGAAVPTHLALGLGLNINGFGINAYYLTLSDIIGNTFGGGLSYSF